MAVVADSGLLGDPPREAEVRQVDVVGAVGAGARVEQHVGGLHVAMHKTARVGRIQGARHLRDDADRVRRVQTAALQALLEVTPLDVAHGDEEDVLGRPGLVDRDDVRMVDRRGQLRLAQEAVTERLVLGEARSQQLERDLPLEPQILGQVDDAHAAQAQQRLDPIAGELGADPRVVAHLHVRILAFGACRNDKPTRESICKRPALQRCFRRVTRLDMTDASSDRQSQEVFPAEQAAAPASSRRIHWRTSGVQVTRW